MLFFIHDAGCLINRYIIVVNLFTHLVHCDRCVMWCDTWLVRRWRGMTMTSSERCVWSWCCSIPQPVSQSLHRLDMKPCHISSCLFISREVYSRNIGYASLEVCALVAERYYDCKRKSTVSNRACKNGICRYL